MSHSSLEIYPEMFDNGIPPAVPKVFIDSELQIAPEETNFDFEAFYELTREAGLSDSDISSFTQRYSGAKAVKMGGMYNEKTRESTIFVPSCTNFANAIPERIAKKGPLSTQYGVDIFKDTSVAGVINETTVHELGHHVEQCLGRTGITKWLSGDTENELVAIAKFAVFDLGNLAWKLARRTPASFPTERVAFLFQEQHGNVPLVSFTPPLIDLDNKNHKSINII